MVGVSPLFCRAKNTRRRVFVYLLSIPLVSFLYGILSPTTAVADEAQSPSGGDAGNNNNQSSSASSGGDPQVSSGSSAPESLTEATTVVATAASTVTSL